MNDASVNPYLPTPARILEVRAETAADATYRLAWPTPPLPGQFFEAAVPGLGEAPISVSGMGEGYIEMTLRKVGRVTDGIFALKPGDELYLRGPYGHGFPLDRFRGRHLVIAAGGTGLAPVRGVIHHFLRAPEQLTQLDILAGFRSPSDILFRDELAHWSARANLRVTVDRPAEGWTGHVGVITKLVPDLNLPELSKVEVVVVGPPMMMKFAVLAFRQLGIEDEHIWVSYERRMSCGIGKCGHCKINDRYVCLDGPVFNFAQAQWLVD